MEYVVVFLAGAAAATSGLAIWYLPYVVLLRRKNRWLKSWDDRLQSESSRLGRDAESLDARRRQVDEEIVAKLARQTEELENRKREADEDIQAARRQADDGIASRMKNLEKRREDLDKAIAGFEGRQIKYDALVRENAFLKQDLFNLSVRLRKTERDHADICQRQEEISQRTDELAARYLDENVTWISAKLTPNNFATCKQRLQKVVDDCRGIGFQIPEEKEQGLIENLKKGFEEAVKKEFAREEQARIKAQIREEEKLAREIEKQIQDAEREQAAIQAALDKALKEAQDEHSAQVEHLRAKLKEAEEKAQRAISRAQMTKSGYVYVLSNIGSFGEGVFKIGMTRRLEPQDRVRELGDASVPFPFDVHMMVSCNDAPALENALHRELHERRLNKVNFRKEFFRVELESIREVVETNHGEVAYVAEPEALQYRESVNMGDADYEFVEQTVGSLMDEEDAPGADD